MVFRYITLYFHLFFKKICPQVPSQTVVIFDPFKTGHHADYLKTLSEQLGSEFKNVIVICDQDLLGTINFPLGVKVIGISIPQKIFFSFSFKDRFIRNLICMRRWLFLFDILRREGLIAEGHHLFMPWLDSFIFSRNIYSFLLAKCLPLNCSGIIFQPTRDLSKNVGLFNSKKFKRLYILVKSLIPTLTSFKCNVFFFPDFPLLVPPGKYFPSPRPFKEVYTIALVGSLDSRKNVLHFLRLAHKLALHTRDFKFILAGAMNTKSFRRKDLEEIRLLTKEIKNLGVLDHVDGRISDQGFISILERTDILFAAYQNFDYSSNMLGLSCTFKIPLVASFGTYLGNICEEHRVGITVPSHDVDQMMASITTLKENYTGFCQKSKFDNCLKEYCDPSLITPSLNGLSD